MELRKYETRLIPHVVLIRANRHPFKNRDAHTLINVENIITKDRTVCDFPRGQIHALGDDITSLRDNVEAVVVTLPDVPNLRFGVLEWIKAKFPKGGIPIILVRGGQGGQIALINEWRNDEALRKFDIILIEDSFYGTRYLNHQIAFKRKLSTNVSVFGERPEQAFATLQSMFTGPSVEPGFHQFKLVRPLDLQFDPLGYIIHLAVALDATNLKLTEQKIKYLHYCEGVHEGNAELINTLDRERVQLASGYGAATPHFPDILKKQYGLKECSSFLELMKSTVTIYRSLSPDSLDDLRTGRLIQEDVPGLLTIEWLASKSDEQLPLTRQYAQDTKATLQRLGVDLSVHGEYVRRMVGAGLCKTSVIELLAQPW
ncbi:NAD/NADP octopine/nopaline dehydrogenase family protein [Aeromonas caviae]|uniref:NAD/NADP octopine/nopaline dehydrogenase family protein n=2 Tax=Aeromonadaceae TaxID=84642 RepID=UPI0029D846FC|nr:NAD/NADP octopine/nopaline dehydrogenase family protein [Aeromonas caviae]MDX7821328.1 NAD/NADP octopine/nopaline dehydrogenase family protein [Aeromonas caviae]